MKIKTLQNIFLLFILILCIASCSERKYKSTIIKGNIPNLPDGTMYLFKETMLDKIDSVSTIKGKFKIIYKNTTNAPVSLGLFHIDKKNIRRDFGFPTNSKYRNAPLVQSVFLSDPVININGFFFDNTPKGFPKNVRLVNLKNFIVAGKQTEALYNIDFDFFEKINDDKILLLQQKIKKYPFSYYILDKIIENKNSFSPQQVNEFLKLFKGEITQSDSYKKLSAYNQKRFNEKNISIPQLENDKGIKSQILDPKYKKHLVVFWASWCGPCREEIPLLKKLYGKDSSVEFVSISIDSDKNAWQKALKEEQMNWKQLIINEKDSSYESLQILFKLNEAIPYTVLVDSNMKILNSSVGLSSEKDLFKLIETK